jgi:putative RNA 2'-phosphotransferase
MTSSQDRSKYLSYLLRHKPETARLTLDKEGWCSIAQLIANTDFTVEELETIVAEDAKTRYAIRYWVMGGNEDLPETREPEAIRANQGHSTNEVKMTFKKAIPPTVLYHGADDKVLHLIMKKGLLPIKRHHVHLSADIETANAVGGRRKSGHTVLIVDAKKMLTDGHTFYISDNGVWLSSHVLPQYLKELE